MHAPLRHGACALGSAAPEAATGGNPKFVATLKARAALAGAQLLEIEGDDGRPVLILTRWALTRSFTWNELDALDRTLTLMGAPA